MKRPSYVKLSGLIFLFLTMIVIGLAFFLPRLIDINAYRTEIIDLMQQTLNRRIDFSRGDFTMHTGPSFTFEAVSIKEPDGTTDLLKARRVTVHLALLPLLEKRVVLSSVILDQPELRLAKDAAGRLNIDDLLQPRPEGVTAQVKGLTVKNGTVHWEDLQVQQGLKATVTDLDLVLDHLGRNRKCSFKIAGRLAAAKAEGTRFSFSGTAKVPKETVSLLETRLDASLDIKQAEPGRFWAYYGRHVPFPDPGGRFDLTGTFKGKPTQFAAKGRLKVADISVNWPAVFHHPVDPRLAQLDYDIRLDRDVIDMPLLGFSAAGFKFRGSCRLEDIRSADPRIIAHGVTEPFKLEGLRNYIPYGIIATDVSEYIEQHIMGGIYRLESGTLNGRVSQIVHMERGDNYNVLHIKGIVEKGILSYGKKVPVFGNIRGGLEMLGKDFILSGVTGTFGDAPFRMEGRITDYPLVTPCSYLFRMDINPTPAEVAWLARLAGANKLETKGSSTLHLTGSGLIKAYNLSGDWDLKPCAYSFPGAVRKPAGQPSQITFSAVLGPDESRLTSLTYRLDPLTLSATARFNYADTPDLAFELQTNQFMLGDTLPILLAWQGYRPRGRIQAHITGAGNPRDFTAMSYDGAIGLSAFSFQPGKTLKPVSNINGSIMFKGTSLETSSINVLYGSSRVSARGRLRNFAAPEAEITLKSPEFFLKDINIVLPKADAAIRKLDATVIMDKGGYRLRNVTGQYNDSDFTVNGTYAGGAAPRADFAVQSAHLNVDDLLFLGKLGGGPAGGKEPQQRPEVKVRLAADSALYDKLPFTRLSAALSLDEGVLSVQSLEAGLYGGKVAVRGTIAPAGGGARRYNLSLNAERVRAERLFETLQISREVTGSMNVQGDLSATGATLPELKRTANGNVRLRLEKGSLKRFSVLSKVFSILNVSQLLKFQAPDMVSGGMPYNEIKGSIGIKDGIASSQDLFISSDAMNISVVGSADLIKEELNTTIGVQPLQTVDKIVNRIPVVGWLLTGKDKAVVVASFEAKGKWSDPQVTAVNAKSMAKGVMNVFRRVFELPVRMFTDTGEVFLGQ